VGYQADWYPYRDPTTSRVTSAAPPVYIKYPHLALLVQGGLLSGLLVIPGTIPESRCSKGCTVVWGMDLKEKFS